MKRFYICPKCGQLFCLKGNKYCREMAKAERTSPKDSGMLCQGKNNGTEKTPQWEHEKCYMTYVGGRYEDLVQARKERMKK